MMHYPKRGEKAFEFTVYNHEVRELVKANQHHEMYGDEWADAHLQSICAGCEAEARRRIAAKFPEKNGFIVAEVRETVVH